MSKVKMMKFGAVITGLLFLGQGAWAQTQTTEGGLFNYKGPKATAAELSQSRDQKYSQDGTTKAAKKKKKKKRRKPVRRGSFAN